MTLETVTFVAGFPFMAFCAVVHFHPHAVLGRTQSGDVVSPYIPAVTRNPVFLVGPAMSGPADIAMAGGALHVGAFDMGGMGEENTVRLLGVDKPGEFLVGQHILIDEFFLFRVCSLNKLMAAGTGIEIRNAREAAVFPKIVAALAAFVNNAHMKFMIEINRLLFFGVEKVWKNEPAAKHAADKANDKKEQDDPAGAIAALFGGIA